VTRRDILTAIPTSFNPDGTLDETGSRAIFHHVAQSGNEGAFVLGTTGEFPSVNDVEFRKLVSIALDELSDVMRVVIHVGQSSAFEAVRRMKIAQSLGATEFAAVTPYFIKSSESGVFDYFSQLSDAVDGGTLYVYIYPARSGNSVSAALLARLAELPGIVGAKVSELPLATIAEYRAAVPEGFIIYTGADRDLIDAASFGAQGVVSGVSSVLPKPFRALAAAAENGDSNLIAAAQKDVDDVVQVIGGDMARMKTALRLMGISDGVCRMALDIPDLQAVSELQRVITAYR
jgi:4-hydroxy-tetrahydrodipicolinate synthase